jgi:acylphosphatase
MDVTRPTGTFRCLLLPRENTYLERSFGPACRKTSATILRLQKTSRGVACYPVETLAKRYYVSGTVQGVGFRFFTERVAARLGIAGYVKNTFDGRVEVYAIGNAAQLEALGNELRRGPRMASVGDVIEADADVLPAFSKGFTIERRD